MYIVLIIIILIQVIFAFYLINKNADLKEKIGKRDLAIEIKENQIVIAENKVKWHEQINETIKNNLLNIKNFENLHDNVEFPVVENEDGTGMLISRRCQNRCIIESHDYPSYDLALMVSKCITELGFKMEEEYCIDCKKISTEELNYRLKSAKANK